MSNISKKQNNNYEILKILWNRQRTLAKSLKRISKKISTIEAYLKYKSAKYERRELAMNLYLVKYDNRDGTFMSDMQRWLEGKPNEFFKDE